MADLTNVGQPSVANRGFIALAIEAGIESVINSLVPLAKDRLTLLIAVKDALAESNQPLADALNDDTLGAILDYMASKAAAPVLPASALPTLLDEDGPGTVSAGRDGSDATQINIGFSTPPADYTAEIYLDGVYQKDSTQTGSPTVFDTLTVENDLAVHTVRVLFRRESDGAITRFGPIAEFQ